MTNLSEQNTGCFGAAAGTAAVPTVEAGGAIGRAADGSGGVAHCGGGSAAPAGAAAPKVLSRDGTAGAAAPRVFRCGGGSISAAAAGAAAVPTVQPGGVTTLGCDGLGESLQRWEQ